MWPIVSALYPFGILASSGTTAPSPDAHRQHRSDHCPVQHGEARLQRHRTPTRSLQRMTPALYRLNDSRWAATLRGPQRAWLFGQACVGPDRASPGKNRFRSDCALATSGVEITTDPFHSQHPQHRHCLDRATVASENVLRATAVDWAHRRITRPKRVMPPVNGVCLKHRDLRNRGHRCFTGSLV